jgi:hypothetical protein
LTWNWPRSFKDTCGKKKNSTRKRTAALELLEIIGAVPHTKCKEDEDRIYALIGAANWRFPQHGEEADNQPAPLFHFRIDYGEGSTITYARFSLALIQIGCQAALEMLRFTSALPHSKNMLDKLPSWVPDWSQPIVPKRFTSQKEKHFSAGGEGYHKADVTSLDEGNFTSGGIKLVKSPCRQIRGQIQESNARIACVAISFPFDKTITISGPEVDAVRFSSPPINASNIKTRWPEHEALWRSLQSWWLLVCKTRANSGPSY